MRACGPGEFMVLALVMFLVLVMVMVSGSGSGSGFWFLVPGFWFLASFEAQLNMMARRLSHRVVAIGSFPPSSESWRPTHSTHKFTRAHRVGGRAVSCAGSCSGIMHVGQPERGLGIAHARQVCA